MLFSRPAIAARLREIEGISSGQNKAAKIRQRLRKRRPNLPAAPVMRIRIASAR